MPPKRLVVLNTVRRRRNVPDYAGEGVATTTAALCIAEAKRLIDDMLACLFRDRVEGIKAILLTHSGAVVGGATRTE